MSKSSSISIGGIYERKVGIRTVEVRIERENPKGGFDATSVASGKPIRVKDASRLRPAKRAVEPDVEDETEAVDRNVADEVREAAGEPFGAVEVSPADGEPAVEATPAPQAAREPRTARKAAKAADGRMSCLDAATAVLRASGEPMQCKPLVEALAAQGLWTSTAPTPAATLSSAILREIHVKGAEARFKKTDRGHFTLADAK